MSLTGILAEFLDAASPFYALFQMLVLFSYLCVPRKCLAVETRPYWLRKNNIGSPTWETTSTFSIKNVSTEETTLHRLSIKPVQ